MDVLAFRDSLVKPDIDLYVGSCFGSRRVINLSEETKVELRAVLDKALKEGIEDKNA